MGREDCEDDLAREATIHAHLGDHPQILKCFGLEEHCAGVHSLRLELAPLGCRNLFLLDGFRVKLGDFGASLLEGRKFRPTFCEETQYELP